MSGNLEDQASLPSLAATENNTRKQAKTKNPRGRPRATGPETPQQLIDRLEKELQQAREAKRMIGAQREAIVGRVEVARAAVDADYRRDLATRLRAEVKNRSELAAIGELLD